MTRLNNKQNMNYFLFNVSLNLTTTMPPGEWILTNLLNTTAQSYENVTEYLSNCDTNIYLIDI